MHIDVKDMLEKTSEYEYVKPRVTQVRSLESFPSILLNILMHCF